ncbi:putative transcription factor interactor and regulator C3H-WRC/GRF family [Medicago truncatula]|uniref:Growth-regulating factor n=1 Tax=Medicago truncatula TaxID=3880 RepID=G7LCR8_MEDTR|nr:growth-regulating factor 4 [Medicago truncatula]RHN40119.1 putative transcription factor interactor and regulator C3H-WRC/GRF family [Medicago truncatula]
MNLLFACQCYITNFEGKFFITKLIELSCSFSDVISVSGCNDSYLNNTNSILEPEPGRCRRTDGKKWRCKSAVLPGQKYCATLMHRGAKRRFTNLKFPPPSTTVITTTTDISSAVTIPLPYPSTPTDVQKANCWSPSTKLSTSIPESEPFVDCNEKSYIFVDCWSINVC